MDKSVLKELLQEVSRKRISVDDAMEKLRDFPYQDMGFAKIDTHRHLRKGFPEVVLAQRKTVSQLVGIVGQARKAGTNLLVTRLETGKAQAILRKHPELRFHPEARTLYLHSRDLEDRGRGTVLVVSAGTSDIPVAEEAAVTAEVMGNAVTRIFDVGVAGLHRLLAHYGELKAARVLIVVAGMEGALPSVVGGLVDRPVIAVPTSVGYGASLNGMAALLGMLNACASGITVVNIDNGFGAGYAASLMNRL